MKSVSVFMVLRNERRPRNAADVVTSVYSIIVVTCIYAVCMQWSAVR